MMNKNTRIDEELTNGTPCRGLYIKLKSRCEFIQENWEGLMVNTIFVNQVQHILCIQEGSNGKYFLVKPETRQRKIKLRKITILLLTKLKLHICLSIVIFQPPVTNSKVKHWTT